MCICAKVKMMVALLASGTWGKGLFCGGDGL